MNARRTAVKKKNKKKKKQGVSQQLTFKIMKTVSWRAGLTAPSYCFFFPWGRGGGGGDQRETQVTGKHRPTTAGVGCHGCDL